VLTDTTLDLDARRRVSLGALFDEDVTHLIAHKFEDGSVVLEPATVVSKLEQRFHEDQVAVEAARRAAQSSGATKVDLAARRAARRTDG
jgi:F420-0:gamma-glutamyl ligase